MKWIRVDQRLPENTSRVYLVRTKDNDFDLASFRGSYWLSWMDGGVPIIELNNVTHWCEIEPPESEGK